MQTPVKTTRVRIKEKLWVWRPILLFAVIGFFVFAIISNSSYTTNQLKTLRGSEPITKIEMKLVSDEGTNDVVLTNRMQLDSIDNAFKEAKERHIQIGGAFKISAEINVYKGIKKVNLFIQYSIYNGWMIEVGTKTLSNEYLFELIKRYAKNRI